MSNAIFGWNNLVLSSTLVSGCATATGMGTEQLQDETGSPTLAWQTASAITIAAGATLVILPTATQAWRAMGVFRTNLTGVGTVTFRLYDNYAGGDSASWVLKAQKIVAGPEPGYGQAVAIFDADVTAQFGLIGFDDPTNPDGFINVPLAFAGPAWQPVGAPSWDTTFGRDAAVDEIITRGGQEFPTLRWNRRRWDVSLAAVRPAEVWGGVGEMDRVARSGGNVLFVPDMTSAYLPREATYGRMVALADVAYPYGAADRRSWRGRITERI